MLAQKENDRAKGKM